MGLDWDAIRADYEKRATPEELGISPQVKEPKKKVRKSRAKTGTYNYSGPKPSFDVEEAMELYLSGLRIGEVAKKLGISHDTIYNHLKRDPRYDPNRDKGGSKPKTHCINGHDYDEVGFYSTRKGGRDCKACKKERDKERRAGAVRDKDYCKKGHKYDEVGYYRASKGGRECKACKKERDAERYQRNKNNG